MEIQRNTFEAGLDTNISPNLVPANRYIDAANVNLVESNQFFALENIKGTTELKNLDGLNNAASLLGVFASKYKIGDTFDVPCLTAFYAVDSGSDVFFHIVCYDTRNDDVYYLYEEVIDPDYPITETSIDAILYPENGIDIIYFTDNYFPLRKLRCEIPLPYTVNFLEPMDLRLLQHGANGNVVLDSVSDGGSLFCGSYQIAYQFLVPETNEFTKFSLFSNPIQVYLNSPFPSDNDIRSGVGLQSPKKILINIFPSEEELNHYTHFRLAVIENIEPSGVLVEKAYLTQVTPIADYNVGSFLLQVPYDTNIRLETINLSDIVVDKLALDTAKTLSVRQNRLIAGNIKYRELDYDNGTPVISGGSIIKQGGNSTYDNLFSDPTLSSRYRGHFRNEVYRYAISYFDEDGNFSSPSVLDLASVTHNQITGAYKDMKFPDRSQNLGGTTYTLFKNSDGIQSLGLRLTGVDNHPTWAKGFVILRAERIKDILFQTPIIPLNEAYAVGALEEYPFQANELSGTTYKTVQYPDAGPMGPFTTYIPKNFFWLISADIKQYLISTGATGAGLNKKYSGEAFLSKADTYSTGVIYAPSYMYESKSYNFSPAHKLQTVDAALLTLDIGQDFSNFSIGSTTHGRNIKTSISGTFHALKDTFYYYNSSHNGAKATLSTASRHVVNGYEEFVNLGSGSTVGGSDVFRYDKLETPGITWGTKANVQKCGVVKFSSSRTEINNDSALVFAGGSQIAKTGVNPSQAFLITSGSNAHTVEIANMVTGQSDERYGRYDTPHNFIFTGTIVTFTDGEVENFIKPGLSIPFNVDVWGGDCYVTPHLFKVVDTSYGVTNSEKFEGLASLGITTTVRNWEREYDDDATGSECSMSIPVPYKNAAQFVQLVLESEYNTGVMDNEITTVTNLDGILPTKMPIYGINTENTCRVPLTYQLNVNHKKGNSDKIFSVKDPLLPDNIEFNARFIYSDQKVYQTSIVGFDSFRVLNFKDLEETYGELTKLQTLGDDLYAFQEKAISYLGVGERTLETTDALTLAVQSGEFIGNIILVDNNKGTQHLRSVLNTGNAIYFVDNLNQSVSRLAGRQIDVISEKTTASTFRSLLSTNLDKNKVHTIYDPIRKQLWFSHYGVSPFCYVFDEARNIWISKYGFNSTLQGGVYQNQQLYLIGGVDGTNLISSMYTGPSTTLFGLNSQAYVQLVVNPKMELGKVFDDVLVVSSDRLNSFDVIVNREAILGAQTASGITLDVTSRGEGNFKAKILRDSAGARLRGTHAKEKFYWDNPGDQIQLVSVLNKYRISDNRF